jgi:predicted branched-subunit amino acid permease
MMKIMSISPFGGAHQAMVSPSLKQKSLFRMVQMMKLMMEIWTLLFSIQLAAFDIHIFYDCM